MNDSKSRKWLYNIQKNKKQPPYYQLSTALQMFTGNYRDFAGKSECRDFKIYGDCMYTCNPCNFEIPHSYFHCNICREFDFTGILRGFPALDVGKPCNNLIFLKYPCKICKDNL